MKLQKETNSGAAVHGRWYDDACGTAFALELIGERWSLLIVRELIFGGRRFSDLRAHLPGISAKVLTQRLEGLEAVGVLARRKLPPPAATQIYELTSWGHQAEPLLQELGRWAAHSPLHDPTLPLSPVSLMLSMRTMFDPARAGDLAITAGFDIAGEQFLVQVADQALIAKRSDGETAEIAFAAPVASMLAGIIYSVIDVAALGADSGLSIRGDEVRIHQFLDVFALPEQDP